MYTFPLHLMTRCYTLGTPRWRVTDSGVAALTLGTGVLRARDELGQALYGIDLRFDHLSEADVLVLNTFITLHKRGVTTFYLPDPGLGPLATARWQTWTCRLDPANPPRIEPHGQAYRVYHADIPLLAAVPTAATAMLAGWWQLDDGGAVLEVGTEEALEVGTDEVLLVGGGTEVLDSSGNARHGTSARDVGAMVSPTAAVGSALLLNGTTDYIEIADAAALRLTAGGMIMAWIRPASLGGASNGRIADKSAWYFALAAGNRLQFRVATELNGTLSTANAITLGVWQHVAVAFDGTGRRLWVDGVDVTDTGGTRTALPASGTGVLRLGNRATATDRAFDGALDDVRIYGRPGSVWEVRQVYHSGSGTAEVTIP